MFGAMLATAESIWEKLQLSQAGDQVTSYLAEHGPALAANFVAALIIFIVGRWAARLASHLLSKLFARAKVDETLARFLCRVAHAMVLIFVVLAALDRLGFNTTSAAAILAAAGLAIGMALQGSLSNFAAGVMIILFRPFKVGDYVEAGGASGVVEEIHIFNTHLRTPDNISVIVPNSAVTGGNIRNFSAKATRRIDLVVGCGYDDKLPAVKRFLEDVVAGDERILPDPAPVVAVSELADSSVNFVVRPWVTTADYWAVRWDLTERIKLGFDQHGFQIPFPQRDMHLYQAETSPANSSAENAPTPYASSESGGLMRPRRAA